MRGVAEFQALLRVSNERSLGRLTSRVLRETPLELDEAKSREYWKDEGLRDVRFPVLLEEGLSGEGMMCQLLAAAWSIGGPWTVLSVGEPYVPGWEFVAIADHRNATISIPGVEWVRISLLLDTAG